MSLKAIKITNPLFLGQIGPHIQTLNKRMNIAGITYETLYAYFVNVVQNGQDMAEFWMAYEGDEPGAFACWMVKGSPFIGTVALDFAHSWMPNKALFSLLVDEYIKFGTKCRCPLYDGTTTSIKLFKHFQKIAEAKGLTFIETTLKTFKAKKN